MWAKFRTSLKIRKGIDPNMKQKGRRRSLNVNEEYFEALRTKSYADFLMKAQLLIVTDEPSSSSSSSPDHDHSCINHQKFSEILLEPTQETIKSILESSSFSTKHSSDLKLLLSTYFDISAEASNFCSHLLKSITQVHSNYKFLHEILVATDNSCSSTNHPQLGHIIASQLSSFMILTNPISVLNKQDHFTRIHDKYASMLQHLKSKRAKVNRKLKLIKYINKGSGVCVTAFCGLVATAALVLAAHTLAALILGPAIFSLPLHPMKKKILSIQLLKTALLRKAGEQLDVAAKGTYILNRDFDTMSRLVARLNDEIEHNKMMIKLCLERRDEKFSLQVMKELKKSNVGFKEQIEELEEHVYLCLVTINRSRSLLIKEIAA